MLILVLGVALWWAAHLFKRFAPAARASMGDSGRAAVTGGLVLSVLLMIWGYRAAPMGELWWGSSPATKGINNLLILIGFYLFAASGMKTAVAQRLRHPQLIGFSLWAFGHLLVNGDMPSLVLFGGLLVWAVVEMVVINRAQPRWSAPAGPVVPRKEVMAIVGTLVVYGAASLIHIWLGYNPFGA
ncbi:MAG: NnrU family protein [Paracoccus sp. (in: a-proteobacteria)]|nr:NnrU family protein [Paracoccus sp. (in: a-proteobacteria)]